MKKYLLTFVFALFGAMLCLNAQIIISEIMYNPPEAGADSLEFVELHNPTNASVNLMDWSMVGVNLTFDASASIPAGGYLVLAGKSSAVQAIFGVSSIEWSNSGLSNSGETIQLLDASGNVVDEVDYEPNSPWPFEANGTGYSMELCDLTADNSLPENWKKSGSSTGQTINNLELFASPGQTNGANCLPNADHTITAQGLTFSPADITINQGETVLWVNQGGNHNVDGSTATYPNNPEGFSNGPASNSNWTFIHQFNIPGVYNYECTPHASLNMKGKITVQAYQSPDVVITEFMYNDPGPDSLEYLELYNQGTTVADLSGWTFSAGITHIFDNGTTIQPGGYLVLAKYADYFNSYFGFMPVQWASGALTNNGEIVELRDGLGNVIDQFAYEPNSPWPNEANGTGASVVLCDPASDNSQANNWLAASTSAGFSIGGVEVFANPNAPSGCSGNTDASNDQVSTAQNIAVTIDVLANDFLPSSVTAMNIVQPALGGTATVQGDSVIRYTPNFDFCGDDSFDYEVCTAAGCDTATVDVTVICYAQYTLQQVGMDDPNGVALLDGQGAELVGTVYGVNLRPSGLQFWIIDDSNYGVGVFNNTGDLGYTVKEGDGIKIRGTISQFGGLTQINPDEIEFLNTNNPLVTPEIVTALSENTESKLIRINNLQFVNPAEWTTGMGTSGFTARAFNPGQPNDTIDIRIDRDVSLFNATPLSNEFDLIGIGSQFDQSSPYSSGYQILPRYDADVLWSVSNKEAALQTVIKFGPNPTSEVLWVKSEELLDRIRLFNSIGQLASEIQNPSLFESLNLSGLSEGLYFIQFEKEGKMRTERVVKH